MNRKDLVSVVVPVYNGEAFLRENVECIIGQTHRNLEIIYICDKCTDNTVSILQEYAATDSRLVVRDEKERHGAGISRNIGKEMAHGDWIIFLDSDDLFESDMLETLLLRAVEEGADMCCCFWESFMDKPTRKTDKISNVGLKLYCDTYPVIEVSKVRKYILQLVFYAPWMKLIHKSVYKKENVYFQSLPNCDDIYFSMAAAVESTKIVYVDRNLVYYRIAQGRDTLSANQEDGIKENYICEALDKVYGYICNRDDNRELKQSFYYRVCSAVFSRVGYGIYEKIFNRMRDIYFEKWGMWKPGVLKELSYFNREVYTKIQDRDLDMCREELIMHAKRKYICDMATKGSCSVWGCGNNGRIILEKDEHCVSEVQHLYDSDKNKWGTYISGKVIEKFDGKWSDCIIVTSPQYYEEIKMYIGDRAGMVVDLEKEIWMY